MKSLCYPKKVSVKGFSLIEMILYVSICSIILLSLATFYIFLLSSRVKSQVITDVEQQGLQVVRLITYTTRNAKSLDTPALGSSSTALSLSVVDPLLSPTVFDVSASGTMRIKEGSGPYISLTNSHVSVSSSSFQNISSTSSPDRVLKFTFTLSGINLNGRNEYSYKKTFTGSATLRQ